MRRRGNFHAPLGSVDPIARQHQLRREPGRASQSRSSRHWTESFRVKPRLGISCRVTSRPGPSAPIGPIRIFRLPGNSQGSALRKESNQLHRAIRFLPERLIRRPYRLCSMSLRFRAQNEPHSLGEKPNVERFAR
jgi:hypothetical protein